MFNFKFADIGEGIHEGKVAEITVKTGDKVKDGQTLFLVETDKVNAEIPSPTHGIIKEIRMKVGDTIHVGDTVVVIDDGSATKPEKTETKEVVSEKKQGGASVVGEVEVSDALLGDMFKKSAPVAKTTNAVSEIPQDQFKLDTSLENNYDVLIIGAGPGGYVTAHKAANSGLKTGIVEMGNYGGVCLNRGCIPTKTLLRSAKAYKDTKNAADFGIHLPAKTKIQINWNEVLDRKNKIVGQLTKGVEMLLKGAKVAVHEGEAQAIDSHTIKVGRKTLRAKNLVIATGSKPRFLPLDNLQELRESKFLITSTEAINLPDIPTEITIIGGGVIGLEFATLFNALGTKVTVIEFLPDILGPMDDDIKRSMRQILEKEGIKFIFNAAVEKIQNQLIHYKDLVNQTSHKLKTKLCLMSVGRSPVLNDSFKKLGLNTTKAGYLQVDKRSATNVPGVWAIGDITGILQLAHKASSDGLVVVSNILGEPAEVNLDLIPAAVYTFPEAASVGPTERELKSRKISYEVVKFNMAANGKALAEGTPEGFFKLLFDRSTGEIYGAHMLGHNTTDMIAGVVSIMQSEGTIHELANACFPHPTTSEGISEAARKAVERIVRQAK